MYPFPVTIDGTRFADMDALVAHVADRFHRGVLRNPGEYHSAQYYTDHASTTSPEGRRVERALWEVAAILVRSSDDPYALDGAACFCGRCRYEPVYEAVIARLDGTDRPFPESPGNTLRWRFIELITQYHARKHPVLGPRIRTWLKRSGHYDHLVAMLIYEDPNGEILEAVESAVRAGGLDIYVLSQLASRCATERQEQLLPIARIIATLPERHRREYLDAVGRYAGEWFYGHKTTLKEALAL